MHVHLWNQPVIDAKFNSNKSPLGRLPHIQDVGNLLESGETGLHIESQAVREDCNTLSTSPVCNSNSNLGLRRKLHRAHDDEVVWNDTSMQDKGDTMWKKYITVQPSEVAEKHSISKSSLRKLQGIQDDANMSEMNATGSHIEDQVDKESHNFPISITGPACHSGSNLGMGVRV